MTLNLDFADAPAVAIRGEPDYYGASLLIATSLGLSQVPASRSTWMHGCEVVPVPRPVFSPHFNTPEQTHLVANLATQRWWRDNGFHKTIAVGCPFVYTERSSRVRVPGSILAMPGHGLPDCRQDFEHSLEWIKTVADLGHGKLTTICLHADDISALAPVVEGHGLTWIKGAQLQTLALPRMRAIFESFEYVISDSQGSHLPYAAWSGCKVALIKPLFVRKWENIKDHPHMKKYPALQQNLTFHEPGNVRARLPFLFVDDLLQAHCPKTWAEEVMGVGCKRSPQEVARMLGWSADDPALANLPYEDVAGWLGAHNPDPKLAKSEDQRRELKKTLNALEKQQRRDATLVNSVSGRIGRSLYSIEKRVRSLFGGNK